jgi:dihydrofolate reductase
VDWDGARLLDGDVAEAVANLKDQDGGELQVHGSAGLIQTLLKHDLVDELRLVVFPAVLGQGKKLFGEGTIPAGLTLASSSATSAGVLILTYHRAGDVQVGSVALDQN